MDRKYFIFVLKGVFVKNERGYRLRRPKIFDGDCY